MNSRPLRTRSLALALFTGLACVASTVSAAPPRFFSGTGYLPGRSADGGVAHAVSADGLVVVGSSLSGSTSSPYQEPFWMSTCDGIHGLGFLTGFEPNGAAKGVSGDGSVIVGWSGGPVPNTSIIEHHAFRWTSAGGMQDLGDFAGGPDLSDAAGVTVDGDAVVGTGRYLDPIDSSPMARAYVWTAATGMVDLGVLPSAVVHTSVGGAITRDALGDLVAVGGAGGTGGIEAFRWTAAGGLVGLGYVPGQAGGLCVATAVTGDGEAIAGACDVGSGRHAFLWTSASGMVDLGDLPGGSDFSVAHGVGYGPAGEILVVGSASTSSGPRAFIWDLTNGMRVLQDVLVNDYGLTDASGWTLTNASAITPDGLVIVGSGFDDSAQSQGWVASLRCPADFNGDGGVGIEDLLDYLEAFENGTLDADVDDGNGRRDCGVGIEDLLYFLDRFELGC